MSNSSVTGSQATPVRNRQATRSQTDDRLPVHSFQSLISDLMTLARNSVVIALAPENPFSITTRPTPIQQKAFALLGVPIACNQ